MNKGIGKEFTREDHKQVSDQIYACYGNTVKLRDLASIIGEGALTDTDKLYLKFGEELERKFINQGFDERRTIEETLEIAWDVLSVLPESELRRLEKVFVEKYGKSRSS
jgi:V/A-type H+-transporting ATPase subunit B